MRGYLARLDGWLERTHRLALVALNRRCAEPVDRLPDYVGDETLWIAFLELGAPHVHHAVVMRGRQLVWDPDGAEDLSVLPDLLERVMTVVLFVPVASVLAR